MTDDLRKRIADAIERDAEKPAAEREGIIPAVLAIVQPELDELLNYRNAITWETSCLSCSRVLDNARAREEELERNVDYFKRNVRRSRDQVDGYDRELSAAKAAVNRVRGLHERREGDDGSTYCDVCSNHGDIAWPCATIAAVDELTKTTEED